MSHTNNELNSELNNEHINELYDESYKKTQENAINIDAQLPKCQHYNRGCYLFYPCCNEFYPCRFCHNDAKTNYKLDPILIHEADRFAVKFVKCRYCLNVQEMNDECNKCKKKFGNYYCKICKLIDLDDKGQYHCEECKICRQGGKTNFTHCTSCGLCVPNDSHTCTRKIDGDCPICCIVLFDSIKNCMSLRCGHWIHSICFEEYIKHNNKCPICSKSISDTNALMQQNQFLDHQIETTPMPDEFKDKIVDMMCNDCGQKCKVKFHFYGLKCSGCSGYNTRQI